MKKTIFLRRFFATLLIISVSALSWAYDFEVGGIYYNINSDGTSVSVTYRDNSYFSYVGSFVIPSSVTYNNNTYSVTSIGYRAFYDCSNLSSVIIPNSVTSIGNQAFDGCLGIISITIPNSVTHIGGRAFYGCSRLTSITIPESVTSISDADVFGGCTSLPVIDNVRYADTYLVGALDKTKSTYSIKDGTRFIGYNAFSACLKLTSISIPNSVTSIGAGAFSSCSSLASITIPEGATSIGSRTFYNCSDLTSITIPESVTSIGNSAFRGCSGLMSITIPNSVTSIAADAFSGCSNLASINLPNSVISIDVGAFNYCPSLNHVELSSIEALCNISFGGLRANPLEQAHHLYIEGEEVTNVVIPNCVNSIGNYAFIGCSSLTSISIPENVTSIGDYAFDNCSGLTSITIPNSVTSIGGAAFSGCSGLTSITIPESVTSIAADAFYGCSGLTSITIPNSVTSIGEWAFSRCSGLTSITIPERVTNIGDCAFRYCSGLTSVTIGGGVTSIGSSTFRDCSGLASVNVLAETPSSIGSNALPSNITKIRVPEAAVSTYKVAENWSAFSEKIIALGGEDNSITVEEIEENKAAGGSANQTYIVTDAAADDVKAADNVIVHSGDNYTCANLVLSDGEPFETMAEEFTATAATYTRNVSVSNTSGTICVPYAFAKEDGVKYYTVDNTRSDDATIYLYEISDDIIPAATPVIYIKDGGKTTMTFSGSNAVAKKAAGTGSGTFELRGTFEKTTITESDELAKSYALSGGKFLCSTKKLTINPFRAYLYNTGGLVGARLNLSVEDDDEPTGITSENVALMSGDAEIEGYYTLEGKRVGSLQKGVVTVIRYANGKSVKVFAQ
jgi:hypothetical protein